MKHHTSPPRKPADGRAIVIERQRQNERANTHEYCVTFERAAQFRRIASVRKGSHTPGQYARILKAGRVGLTAIDAHERLGVIGFYARITELEDAGHLFSRRWVRQVDATGASHRVMFYRLIQHE